MCNNELLAHAVKALAYRFRKAINGSADPFGTFTISTHTRSPNQIINHMYDLAVKTKLMITEGSISCPAPSVLDFAGETTRFIEALHELVITIDSVPISSDMRKRLLQGPILDMATHIGQLAMLNGLNGNPVPKESYYNADIE
ncbi:MULTISPECIES: hypothetical protein [unclassified Spirosoma]|uniref:hypothetical protein n=1 Tax=unclassified Spirosoma TaxID=2621999 RepID=UPI000961ED49|nr:MULTISPECIES: hypothetical protein [unclassified Spirosoma]MBN8820742.1 hypothetical protein [Spirosoma sp.]OJW70714.1 MAG: hypothetical protein BGO59_07900 [Spirosoma sp. 48-14]